MTFPSCRTCKFLEQKYASDCSQYCSFLKDDGGYKSLIIEKPDQFFCSEHETKDGVKWVSWGEK